MSRSKTLSGTVRYVPVDGETGWGSQVTEILDDLIDQVNNLTVVVPNAIYFQDLAANKIKITAPDSVTGYTITLPAADGAANQYLQRDSDGKLRWANTTTAATLNDAYLNGRTITSNSGAVVINGAGGLDVNGPTETTTLAVTGASTLSGAATALDLRAKGSPWFDVKAYGATGDGVTDDTSAITDAITAADAVDGCVYLPPGTYLVDTTITVPHQVMIRGASRWSSVIKYTGDTIGILFDNTSGSTLSDLKLEVTSSAATVVGIQLQGNGGWCQNCVIDRVTIFKAYPLVAGQIGLKTLSVGGLSTNQTVFCTFRDISIYTFDTGVYYSGYDEANVFDGIHIIGFGAGTTGTGFVVNGNNSFIRNVWMGRGTSTGTLTGFSGIGEKNYVSGILDIGTAYPAVTTNLSGAQSIVDVISVGTNFTAGTVKPQSRALGEKVDASVYQAYVMATTGADRYLSSNSVYGYSNGCDVLYQDAPQAMKYRFYDGSLGIGCDPGFGRNSLYVRGPHPWYDAKALGAQANDSTDDTAAIQSGIDGAYGDGGGVVYLPPGTYKIASTLVMKQYVQLRGAGRRSTVLHYTGSAQAITFSGIQFSSLQGIQVKIDSTATVGVQVSNSGSSASNFNRFSDVEVSSSAITAGQKGIYVTSDGTARADYNQFEDVILYNQAVPLTCASDKFNVFRGFQVYGFGSGATGTAVAHGGDGDEFTGFILDRGTSGATALTGFAGSGTNGLISCVANLAATGSGQVFNLAGTGNILRGTPIGSTTYGTPGTYAGIWYDGANNLVADLKLASNDIVLRGNRQTTGSAAPASGTWTRGDVCWNTLPAAAGWRGWVCVSGGTPGTWKGFGAIEA